jgi:hypothetical protein
MDKNLTRRDLLKTTGASLAVLGLPHSLAGAQSTGTTIAIECDGEPRQDTDFVRRNKPRDGV